MTGDLDLDLSALTDDGDELELPDGRKLRLVIEHDPDTDVNDYDSYGTVYYGRPGDEARPSACDGAARKLRVGRSQDTYWWQPPADLKSPKAAGLPEEEWREAVNNLAASVRRLLEDGFRYVGVELREAVADSRGGEHVVTVAHMGMGGIDSEDPSYILEVIGDLVDELDL